MDNKYHSYYWNRVIEIDTQSETCRQSRFEPTIKNISYSNPKAFRHKKKLFNYTPLNVKAAT